MKNSLVRFNGFCRLAQIMRTELFQVLDNHQLEVTTIHNIDFVSGDDAAISAARKYLGLGPLKGD